MFKGRIVIFLISAYIVSLYIYYELNETISTIIPRARSELLKKFAMNSESLNSNSESLNSSDNLLTNKTFVHNNDFDVGNMHFNNSINSQKEKLAVIVSMRNCYEEVKIVKYFLYLKFMLIYLFCRSSYSLFHIFTTF